MVSYRMTRPRPYTVDGRSRVLRDCARGASAVAGVTVVCWFLQWRIGYESVALLYMLSVVLLALALHRWAVLLTATLSALLWNFLFIPPRFTFRINSATDAMMFVMYFVVALVMGHVTNQLRVRELIERRREQRTRALNRLLQSVTASSSLAEGLSGATHEVDELFQARTAILLDDSLHPASTFRPEGEEAAVAAAKALESGRTVGRFTDTLPEATATYLPLQTSKNKMGVMAVRFDAHKMLTLGERELLETLAGQIAVTIERYRLIEGAQQARVLEESERLHRTLLDSVSHELKTPLAVIAAAADGLEGRLDQSSQSRSFLDEIQQANRRLQRIVGNLLDMTRIETGRLTLNLEWCEPGDLLHSAAEQVGNEVPSERVRISVPGSLPLVRLDFGMMEQALCNLLTNAIAHSAPTSSIEMSAQLESGTLALRVSDRGVGLAPGEEQKVFEKFYRGTRAHTTTGGTGLGLAIVQGFVRAHGGEATASNNPDGGATFTIRIPVEIVDRPG